ncbi:LOW QUALITY PROTEIN: O(6)-methylguanine-induced apoptosis 2 [Morphnus guianensis]
MDHCSVPAPLFSELFLKESNETPGPGFYSVTHQSAEINSTSLSKKGTAYFPSLFPCSLCFQVPRTACKKISDYPAANAYKILSCFQPKQDFSKENPSMFQHPIARIEKIPTPAPNQCYVSRFAREDKDGGGSQLMYNVCEVMFDVPEDTRTSCNLPSLGAALRVAGTAQTFAPGTYPVPDDFEVCATCGQFGTRNFCQEAQGSLSALQPFPSELSPFKLHFNARYIHFVNHSQWRQLDFKCGFSFVGNYPQVKSIQRHSQALFLFLKQTSMDFCKQSNNVSGQTVFMSKTTRGLNLEKFGKRPSPCTRALNWEERCCWCHYDINDSLIKVSPKGITSCFKSKTSCLTRIQQSDPTASHYTTWSNGASYCHGFTGTGSEVEVLQCTALKGSRLKGMKGNSLLPNPPPPCCPYEKANKSAYQQIVQVNLLSPCSDVAWPKIKINNKFLTMEKNENMRKPTALLTQQVYLYYISQQLYLITGVFPISVGQVPQISFSPDRQEFCLTLSDPAIPPCKDPPLPGPGQYNPVDYKGSPKQDCSKQTAFVSNRAMDRAQITGSVPWAR